MLHLRHIGAFHASISSVFPKSNSWRRASTHFVARILWACAVATCFFYCGGPAVVQTCNGQSNPIVLENQQPGTNSWDIPTDSLGTDAVSQIKGYASATSVNVGEDINFHISVNPPQNFTIDVYRIGWYQGLGGRHMKHVGPLPGIRQPKPAPDPVTGLIDCNWAVSYTLTTESTWTSGIYLAVLKNEQGFQNCIMFVVRDDSRVGALLYQEPVTTYQAYNNYPNDGQTGKSLYDFNSFGAVTAGESKAAVKVSFNRPYTGAGVFDDFRSWEIHFIRFLERSGYDVTYSTSIDTHSRGARLLTSRGFLTAGHDEYWSKPMYDAAVTARDSGINLGFFAGDSIYWQIRMEPSTDGVADRVMVCYRRAVIDPIEDPTLKTILWRDPPVNRPEQTLMGVQFTAMVGGIPGPFQFPAYVASNTWHWVYAGTGFRDGDTVPGIIGYEADRFYPQFPGPDAVPGTFALLSQSPFDNDYSNSAIYQSPSGAWVFGSGTISWGWGLDSYGAGWNIADARLQRMTANILDQFLSNGATGFALSPSPSARTIAPGSSTTYNLAILPVGLFTGAVDLGVNGLPDGATANFSINPATSSSVLSVTAAANTPTGAYTLTINGTGGAVAHTAPITLTVLQPDFTISASPATRSVTLSGSTTYSVAVNRNATFTDAVSLQVSGLPAGVTAAFSPNPTTGSSTLTVTASPNTEGGTYTLNITGTGGGLSRSTSVTFTYSTGLTVTAPNTAVTWRATTKQNITFSHNLGIGQNATIELSRDGGATWSWITTLTTTSKTSGAYSWTVSGPPTTHAKIRVTSVANPLVTDTSNVEFTIVNPTITVTSPNTAVSWRAGDTKNITFSHNMAIGQIANIEVSRDGGLNWELITPFTTISASSGSYSWVVSGPPTSQAKVRVSWAGDPSVTDSSDVTFTVLPRTTVTAPNTALTWAAGSTRTVTWSHNLGVTGQVDIRFSSDGGASWTVLATGVPCTTATAGSYNVQMPSTPTVGALISVSPAGDPSLGDVSDVGFTLAAPSVTVTAPNTAVTWAIGSTQSIKWNHNVGTQDSVKLELARDGINYTETITASVLNSASTSGIYSWVVTGPATTSAKVRVSWSANAAVSDVSNSAFKIQ